MPERHSGQRRRNSGAECGRVWAGSVGNHQLSGGSRPKSGQEEEFEKEDCGFGYRTSVFNTSARGRYVILRVTFALVHDGEPRIAYADLKKYFAAWKEANVAEVREAVLEIRASKAMLITSGR